MEAANLPAPSFSTPGGASLCDVLDRVVNKGAAVAGEITISIADVDLLHLDLRLVLSSVMAAATGDA